MILWIRVCVCMLYTCNIHVLLFSQHYVLCISEYQGQWIFISLILSVIDHPHSKDYDN